MNLSIIFRFILFFSFFTSFLYSKSIVILPHYCLNVQTELNADFFGAKETFHVITIPRSKSTYTVPSLHVKDSFDKNDYNITDTSNGSIVFERFCNFAGKKEKISDALMDKFLKKYPCLNIENIDIETNSPLPYDFQSYKLIKVDIKNNYLRKRVGSFRAIFKTFDSEKKIYLKYNIKATVDVFKAKHKLYNDKILHSSDYEKISIQLDKLPSKVITCKMPLNLMSKNYVRANSILTLNKFEHKRDVLRGTKIRTYIKDGMLVIEIEAIALKDANIGEIIKLKTDNGKIFNAKLISKYKAIILE